MSKGPLQRAVFRIRPTRLVQVLCMACFPWVLHAQQPITVSSTCLGGSPGPYHNRVMGPAQWQWQGTAVKAVALADGGSVIMSPYKALPDSGIQVTRYDAMGGLVWNYSFTDPGVPYIQPTSMCMANDGGYIISGQTAGYTNFWDPFLLKLDADGNAQWFKTYSCSRNLFVCAVGQSVNGNICMVGGDYFLYTAFWQTHWNTGFVPTENAAAVMITDGMGMPVSFKPYSFHYGGVDRKWECFYGVEPLSGGGFLIAGQSGHNWDFFAITLLKVDNQGTDQWCRHWNCTQFGGAWSSDMAKAAVQDSPISALIGGYVSDHDQYELGWSYHDAFAARINLANGDLMWSKRYANATCHVTGAALANGHAYLSGQAYNQPFTVTGGTLYDFDPATGALNGLHTYQYSPGQNTTFSDMDTYVNGDLLLAGSTDQNGASQAWMVRADPAGGSACVDSTWATPNSVDLTWTEKFMTINDAGGVNPSPVYSIAAQAVDRTLQRNCICMRPGTFCPVVPDTLFTLDTDTLSCAGTALQINPMVGNTLLCGSVPTYTQYWAYYADGTVVDGQVVGGTLFGTYSGATPQPIVPLPGSNSLQVRLRVIDCSGDTICDAAASVAVGGAIFHEAMFGPDTVICEPPFTLHAPPGSSNTTFTWYAGPIGASLAQAMASGAAGSTPQYTVDSSGTFFLLANLNGCITFDSITVQFTPVQLNLPDTAWFCTGGSSLLDASTPGATGYAWSGVANGNAAIAEVHLPGDAIVEVTLGACTGTDTIHVAEHALPVPNLPDTVRLCDGSTAVLDATLPGATAYAWSGIAAGSTPLAIVSSAGNAIVSVTANGCTGSDTALVVMIALPLPGLPDVVTFCPGDSAVLDATVPGATAYAWNGVAHGTSPQVVVASAGMAVVTVEMGGCIGMDTAAMVEIAPPVLVLPDSLAICAGTHAAVLGISQPFDSVAWSTGESTPYITIYEPGLYSATIAGHGCWSEPASTLLYWDDCSCDLYVPNAFTPDGDGLNDAWGPVMDCPLRSIELLVFNRWGELIAELNAPASTWNGTYHGQDCPIGVYPYKLSYASTWSVGQVVKFGHVTLVR